MRVRFHQAKGCRRDRAARGHLVQLLLTRQVVVDLGVVDAGLSCVSCGFHEDCDGDAGSGAGVEYFASLAPGAVALGALVSFEVVDVDVAELILECQAKAVGGVGIEEGVV